MMNAENDNMTHRGIAMFRNGGLFVRGIAAVIIIAFGGLVTSPAVAATRAELGRLERMAPGEQSASAKLNETLLAVKSQLRTLAGKPKVAPGIAVASAPSATVTLAERKTARDALKELGKQLKALDRKAREDFREIEKKLKADNLTGVILQRHYDAVAKYEAEAQALLDSLAAIETAPADKAREKAAKAFERLESMKLRKSYQPFDPNHLPNRALQPNERRKPRLEAEAFIADRDVLNAELAIAANEGYDLSGLADANDAAYLAPTTEVVISDVIEAKAAELDHDPLKIYHWVRNNVKWQPSWGAVQDAELTLSAKRGNAFDIASLTIALLRASGIPARYVHGTIEVPEEKFRNWIGGFEHINAAMNYASSGGIPITYVTGNGGITKVRLEHVWVEAAIDFYPSRGARNRAADHWVAFDPSFKQYEYLEGLDMLAISGVDGETLKNEFLASGTVNKAEDWVSGFDSSVLLNAVMAMKEAALEHIEENAITTMGDVVGGRRIIEKNSPIFGGTPENRIMVVGNRYAELPDSLRQHINFGFGANIFGEPEQSVSLPWAALNNELVTLSFRAATQADEDALQSLLSEDEAGNIQIPTSIPSYLVEVVPELKVGDDVVMTGGPMNFGEELNFVFTPDLVGHEAYPNTYKVIAGSYLAVAVVAGNVGQKALDEARAGLAATKAIIESEDLAQLEGLGRKDLLGDMFHAGILAYYAQYIGLSYLTGLQQGGHQYLAAGLGSFGYEPEVDYLFGIPRSVHGGGVGLNIPMVSAYGYDHDGSDAGQDEFTAYVMQTGTLASTLEHIVPEQMYSTDEAPANAISAVKALGKANRQGQHIYRINSDNQEFVLPNLNLGGLAMNEIRNALATGKEVVAHTDPVSVPGWTGAGYIITDPETGSGAYKIAGGANGGFVDPTDVGFTISSGAFGYVEAVFKQWANDLADGRLMAKIFGTVGKCIGLAGFVVGVTDIVMSCDFAAAWWLITVTLVISLLFMWLGALAVAAWGPLIGFFYGFILELAGLFLQPKRWAGDQCT